jgi:drug/metabolite transporter (DMT)-like permease
VRPRNAGLGLAVISAATFGTSGTFAAALLAAGWSPGAAVSSRIAVAAAVLTVPAIITLRGRWHLLRANAAAIAAYGLVAVAGCQLFYFNAVRHLSVGVALLLEYSGTLLVVLWVWLRHGHRPRQLTITGGVVAIAGLALVLDLTGDQHVSLVGVGWGLLAAAGLAVYFVLSAHVDETLPPIAMAWGGMVIGASTLVVAGLLGAVPLHAATRDADFNGHHTSWWVPIAGLSLVAAVIAYSAGIGAARRLGARLASFIGLAEVLFAVIFAWLLLDQRPSWLQLVGGALVLAGIVLVKIDEDAADRAATEPALAVAL